MGKIHVLKLLKVVHTSPMLLPITREYVSLQRAFNGASRLDKFSVNGVSQKAYVGSPCKKSSSVRVGGEYGHKSTARTAESYPKEKEYEMIVENGLKVYIMEELKEILELHDKWLKGKDGGVRANLSYANLRYADLSSADLRYADLRYADLSSADLSSADLSYANLCSADLRSADLSYADLSSADLSYANLRETKNGELFVQNIYSIGPIGSRKSSLTIWIFTDGTSLYQTGCFSGNEADFTIAVNKHSIPKHKADYLAAIQFINAIKGA